MGLGVIGKRLDVPGTIPGFLERDSSIEHLQHDKEGLKFDRSGLIPILLVPQPSDDPRDPLNLPRWRRDMNLFILCAIGVLAVCLSSIMASNSITILIDLKIMKYEDVAGLTGYHLLAVGLGGFAWVPSSRIWGKRHVYMLGLLMVIAGSAWAGVANNYESLLGARILQGLGVAPFEVLINASTSDLFFVHERGWRMALGNMSIFGGAFFTPVIAGVISVDIGWHWTFKLVAILTGVLFPSFFIFCFESAWRRPENAETAHLSHRPSVATTMDTSPASTSVHDLSMANKTDTKESQGDLIPSHQDSQEEQQIDYPPWSFWYSLAIFTGRKSDENFIKIFFRPIPLFLNPGILWACLAQGTMIAWTVFIGVILAAVFFGPPLNFGPEQIGLLYTGAFIGSVVAFFAAGIIQDPLTRLLVRRNDGVFEPEFRIPAVAFLQLITGAIGLYGFGETAADQYVYGWLIPDVFFAFQVASMVFGAVVSAMYIAEAHRDVAIEGFTCLVLFKNIFTYAVTTHGVDWLVSNGTKRMFIIIGSVQVGIACLALPMYMFGKLNRKLTAKYDLLALLRLR